MELDLLHTATFSIDTTRIDLIDANGRLRLHRQKYNCNRCSVL